MKENASLLAPIAKQYISTLRRALKWAAVLMSSLSWDIPVKVYQSRLLAVSLLINKVPWYLSILCDSGLASAGLASKKVPE